MNLQPQKRERDLPMGEIEEIHQSTSVPEWLSKPESVRLFGKGIRTFERYVAKGHIQKRLGHRLSSQKEYVHFSSADIRALLDGSPRHYPQAKMPDHDGDGGGGEGSGGGGVPGGGGSGWPGTHKRRSEEALRRPWLDIHDAAEYSGLSEEFLRASAEKGLLHCVNENVSGDGPPRWMFNRKGLKKIGLKGTGEAPSSREGA